MDIEKLIKELKPNLKENSIKTYISQINKINKILTKKDSITNLNFLLNYNRVMELLNTYKINSRKSYLSSIIVSLQSTKLKKYDKIIEKYRNIMLENIKESQDKELLQIKTESQLKNWSTIKELQSVLNEYKKILNDAFKKTKNTITKEEYEILKLYLIGSLYIADPQNPPVRLDYADMKIITKKNYEKLDDELKKVNYLVKVSNKEKFFSFGNYKTNQTYGIKIIPIGKKLNIILNKFLKLHSSNYLLLNDKLEPMSQNTLGKMITKTFEPLNKSITLNLLRHIYISEKFPADFKIKEELASKMLHSSSTQNIYAKI